MAVIVVNFYGGINAPSSVFIGDTAGNGSSGANRYTKTISGSATNDVSFAPLTVTSGQVITIGMESGLVGVAGSYAWTVTTIDNGMGVVASVSATSATSVDFNTIFTISGGVGGGQNAVYNISLAITNSAGTTTVNENLLLVV